MPRYHIIIDLSDKKLYLYDSARLVRAFPIGVGAIATSSPPGTYHIINKVPHPGGPFGVFWLGLSKPHYGIHGTNQPSSIGKRSSHGCIRMYNEDVTQLAALVPIGTLVQMRR